MKWKRARGTMAGVKDVGAGGSAHSEWVVVDDVDNTIREPAVCPCKKTVTITCHTGDTS